jgi:methylthioribose-1-phosphate isomerase
MKVNDTHYRSIWRSPTSRQINIIDQTRLPHHFEIMTLSNVTDAFNAIADMHVRGAPLIGATAAYGLALALADECSESHRQSASTYLQSARPTAVNLDWALRRVNQRLNKHPVSEWLESAFNEADRICDEDSAVNETIGDNGFEILRDLVQAKQGSTLNILTHCNAGWLATVDWGTALAPIYKAHDSGINVHVWVDETRPRNQGAALSAWELDNHGVPCTLIVDNAGGHLMQNKQVDICIVGTDRTVANGDVCNKIGTYLKALAANHNDIPFYVALPFSTFDAATACGNDVPIEERSMDEVQYIYGANEAGEQNRVRLCASSTVARNPAFDITPAEFVTGYITEHGVLTQADLAMVS